VTAARIEDFNGVLRHLRGLGARCEPPIGVGSFLLLYASEREVVVWYSPAREQHREGEVAIPCAYIANAWHALQAGEILDETALESYGAGPAGGRWLLALLAQIPGVGVRADPLALAWEPDEAEDDPGAAVAEPAHAATRPKAAKRRAKRAKVVPAVVEAETA
jgi:hypothetical protein